ncbi:MAG: hypothetical protein MUE72_01915 [Chitinophagaceae bacterium]|jgi:hypothetical protein|nr:hypothetical protein [Chitinophagaceae bacterium]
MRKIYCLVLTIIAFSSITYSQPISKITEEEPIEIDGIQYGFTIKNESTKEAGGKDMSRYEITLYATNKSNCLKLFLYERRNSFSEVATAKDDLARFDCKNATGQRLTSKSGSIRARPFFSIAKANIKDCATGKDRIEDLRVQIGFALKPNETVTNNIIVIVPLGEKPTFQVMPNFNSASF